MRFLAALLYAATWALPALDELEARHLLRRTGFDANPAALAALLPLSRTEAVDAVLATARSTPTLLPPEWCRTTLAEHAKERSERWKEAEALATEEARRKRQDELRKRDYARIAELRAWWMAEMCATDSPLTERLVLLWHNHFTSQISVVEDPRLMWEQNRLLRQHATGNFAHLCLAIPFDPAMFRYLDSNSNVARHPNENFAREVMELFTVGEGNYSEQDIKEAARSFSGYKLDELLAPQLSPRDHDYGRKTVLGNTGVFDAKSIIEILLLREENVALNVSDKLWREFINDTPDKAGVFAVAKAFYKSRYQVKAALKALLNSDAFWVEAGKGSLIVSPVELLVTWARGQAGALDVDWLCDRSRQLGMDLFEPPNVKGWRGGRAWITTQSWLERREVVAGLIAGKAVRSGARPAPERDPTAGTPSVLAPQPWISEARNQGAQGSARLMHGLLARSLLTPVAASDPEAVIAVCLNDPTYQLK